MYMNAMFLLQCNIGFPSQLLVLERQVTLILIALSTEGLHLHFLGIYMSASFKYFLWGDFVVTAMNQNRS